MTYIVTSQQTVVGSPVTHVYTPDSGAGNFFSVEQTVPINVGSTARRPSFMTYKGRTHIAGQTSRALVWTEDRQLVASGIAAPTVAPALTGTGSAGTGYAYFVFGHRFAGKLVHQSNPGPVSASAANCTAGQTVANIPTTSMDPRVNVVRCFLQIDSGFPRLLWERELGTVTTVTTTVPTLTLGEALPNFGGVTLPYARGVAPYCRFAVTCHDIGFFGGDPANPARLWMSRIGEMESVDPVNGYSDIPTGEPMTGLTRWGTTVIVFTINRMYRVNISTLSGTVDVDWEEVTPSVGCLANHSIVNINGNLWWAAVTGIYYYDGAFPRPIMLDLHDEWRRDYEADPASYEGGFAEHDPLWQVYIFHLDTVSSFPYVGYYGDFDPAEGGNGSQPYWERDQMDRATTAIGLLADPGTGRKVPYIGSDDGYIRQMNVLANSNDDSDTYEKKMTVRPGHRFPNGQGGDSEDGTTLQRLWSYVEASDFEWVLNVYSGDNYAAAQLNPNWPDTVAASALVQANADGYTYTYLPKTVHYHKPEQCAGRGHSFEWVFRFPVNVRWSGFGGVAGLTGVVSRGWSSRVLT